MGESATTATSGPAVSPQVSVLIVAYNSREMIVRCIEAALRGARATPIEILLIDNGEDGSATLVADRFPQVRIIPGEGNVGFAQGNNLLAGHATAPFLLLLNPDMFVEPGAIDLLVDAAVRHSDSAAWGGVTLGAEGKPDVGNAIAIPSLHELFFAALGRSPAGRTLAKNVEHDQEVEVLSGGFVMLSRQAWDKAGGLDGNFFLYCEEVDLFQRLRNMGYPLWRIIAARGEHAIGHGNPRSPRRMLYQAAGIMEYIRKHWSPKARIFGLALIWFAAFARYLAGKVLGRWRPRLIPLGEGCRLVATRPDMWFRGYHAKHGLKARLDRGFLKE